MTHEATLFSHHTIPWNVMKSYVVYVWEMLQKQWGPWSMYFPIDLPDTGSRKKIGCCTSLRILWRKNIKKAFSVKNFCFLCKDLALDFHLYTLKKGPRWIHSDCSSWMGYSMYKSNLTLDIILQVKQKAYPLQDFPLHNTINIL